MQPKTERYIAWVKNDEDQSFRAKEEERLLIPATSIKGALSHRVAYHYNCLTETTLSKPVGETAAPLPTFDEEAALANFFKNKTIAQLQALQVDTFFEQNDWQQYKQTLKQHEQLMEQARPVGEGNKAVRTLFGYAKEEVGKPTEGARGQVILSDIYQKWDANTESKMFNHVAIDRFTGGGIDGALYKEKVVTCSLFQLCIYVAAEAFNEPHLREAFEKTLQDLITGQLQLGERYKEITAIPNMLYEGYYWSSDKSKPVI